MGLFFNTERESLAAILALNNFRCYFSKLPIKAITDHSALTTLTTVKVCLQE